MKKMFIFFILSMFLLTTFTSATWIIPKETTCNLLNATTISSCDELWCSVIDCTYNSTLESCICGQENSNLNFSEIENNYYNKSEIENIFYNKTFIDERFNNISLDDSNTINGTSYEEYIELKMSELQAQLNGDMLSVVNTKKTTNKDFNPLWVIVILGAIGLFMFFNKNKNKEENSYIGKSSLNMGIAPATVRKIQSKSNLAKEDEIEKLRKELELMRNDKIKKENKKNESEEDEESSDDSSGLN